MYKYNCTLCGAILFPDEAICHCDRIHGDVYVSCPYCRSQCEKYDEAEDMEDAEEREKEEDVWEEEEEEEEKKKKEQTEKTENKKEEECGLE